MMMNIWLGGRCPFLLAGRTRYWVPLGSGGELGGGGPAGAVYVYMRDHEYPPAPPK